MTSVMTAMRRIPLPIHAAVEVLAGILLGVAPFVLGLGSAACVVGVVAAVLVVGLALQSLDLGSGVHVSAHLAADQGISLGLAGSGIVMAATGDGTAATLFGAAALAHLLLIATTRYSAR